MARIPREIIDEIRSRCDIEDVVGSYVSLKRAGSNIKGLCPFHSEKTPSMVVYPSSQSFYCFGCGAGGDVVTFTMKYHNLDYMGAIEYLASRAGISLPQSFEEEDRGVPRKRVYELNLAAARYMRECLFDPQIGGEAMRYLHEERKLSIATIKHFGLGFAPNHPFLMLQHLRGLGFTDDEMRAGYIEAISTKTQKPYSIFRNRVMFPIIDTSGNVIAFGGRVMDDSKPKYLNSSDTPAFKKSRNLFALNFAKGNCAERMILCEGYMDVIALHAAGYPFAVATLGTAITSEQARLMTKYTKQVIITYDSDEAGQKATDRAMKILGEVGMDVRVLSMSGAKDPDEYIKKYGAGQFTKLIDESRRGFYYKMNVILAGHDVNIADEKIRAADEISTVIAEFESGVEREVYTDAAAKNLNIPHDVLKNDVERKRKRRIRSEKSKEAQDARMSARGIGDKVNPDAARYFAANVAEETILGLLLEFPEHRAAVVSGKVELAADDFVTALGRRIFEATMELEGSEGGFDYALMGESFTPDEMGRMQKMMRMRRELSENGLPVLIDSIERLKAEGEKAKAKSSGDRLAAIEARRRELAKKKEENT
ncbi:MAG: DNA primase [Clostridia bacterium]|nr:DNA primase [Clostridia bacterium]